MIRRPPLSYSHRWEFVYITFSHDLILRVSMANVQRRDVTFQLLILTFWSETITSTYVIILHRLNE